MQAAVIWLKATHITALLFWSATLFYLPGLLAQHPRTHERTAFHRLRVITRVTYLGIASPAAIIAIASGSGLIFVANAHGGWLVLKLAVVALMTIFHVYLGAVLADMWQRPTGRSPRALQSLVAIPSVLIAGTLYLVLAKPI
jgi:protoporphyrinogen IX oxidase